MLIIVYMHSITPQRLTTSGAAKAGSSYIPLCLAVMATLLVSCRSVASKAVAAASRSPEYELFLQASVPGCVVTECCNVRILLL